MSTIRSLDKATLAQFLELVHDVQYTLLTANDFVHVFKDDRPHQPELIEYTIGFHLYKKLFNTYRGNVLTWLLGLDDIRRDQLLKWYNTRHQQQASSG
jgi:hypothetical protein